MSFAAVMLIVLAYQASAFVPPLDEDEGTVSKIINGQTSTFKEVVKSPAYIDKTEFIEAFTRMPKHVLLTGPPGFSKSTNLDMLHYFFEHELDEKNMARDPKKSKKLEAFKSSKFFKNNNTLFWSHFSKYPVMKLDFSRLETTDYKTFQRSFFENCVRPLLDKFNYLVNSTTIVKPMHKTEVKLMFSPEYNWGEGSMITFGDLLSTYIHIHHGVKPVLLIDECDAPIRSVLFENHDPIDAECIFQFLIVFVNDIIKQEDIERAFLTGRGRVGAPFMNYGDPIVFSSIFDTKELYQAYGFTRDDLITLKNKLQLSDKTLKDLESRFEGYCGYDEDKIFKNSKTDASSSPRQKLPSKKIFSSFSILQRLNSGLQWIDVEEIVDLKVISPPRTLLFDKVKECIQTNCSFIAKEKWGYQSYLELLNFRTAINAHNFSSIDENMFLQYFLEAGFFTVVKKFQEEFCIAPPNTVIRERLKGEILY